MDFQIILTDLFVSDLKEIVDYLVIRAEMGMWPAVSATRCLIVP